MSKKLSEMSLEELWHLFPVQLTEYNEHWTIYYNEMKTILENILNDFQNICINHIGSTSIKGIWSKPIVDILIEIDRNIDINIVANILANNGFIIMNKSQDRVSLNSGYTEKGFANKVYHLHLRYKGDNNELYFRDYLNECPEIAKLYEQLKLGLWKQYEFNRDGYTEAKAEFIRKYTDEAKARYENKYS